MQVAPCSDCVVLFTTVHSYIQAALDDWHLAARELLDSSCGSNAARYHVLHLPEPFSRLGLWTDNRHTSNNSGLACSRADSGSMGVFAGNASIAMLRKISIAT
jgi:hypothetical protein